MKSWFLLAISLSCALFAAQSAAEDDNPEDPQAALAAKLVVLDGVRTEFSQRINDAQGFLLEESVGTLHLQKPNFRWDVEAPFPQTILARGDAVEIYDPDLEQVTERTIGESLDRTPLALLTSADLDLGAHFDVTLAPAALAGRQRFALYPKADDALFERLELIFVGEQLSSLVIIDHAGQQTQIRFAEYEPHQVIQSSVFELEYPPGTDFVRG